MESPNFLDLNLQFAGYPLNLRMGPEVFHWPNTWQTGRHCNADYEVHILLSGSCVLEVADREIPFSASNAVLIAPGVYHCLHRLSEDFEWFCFSFTSSQKEFSQRLLDQLPSATPFTVPPNALMLCRMIRAELSSPESFQEESIRSLLTQLLVITFRRTQLEFSNQTAPVNTTTWRTPIIDDFFSPRNCASGTEDELAAMLCLSRRQLNRVLLQNYGIGYRQKMLQTRMEYAGNLLRTTQLKAGTISTRVGYAAESSFYKAFQKYYSMTPQQYRDSQKGKE